MDSCSANDFTRSLPGKSIDFPGDFTKSPGPGSILEIHVEELVYTFYEIHSSHYLKECNLQCSKSRFIDTTISEDTLENLQYEREIWASIYWNHRYIFKNKILREEYGIRYWGKYPIVKTDDIKLLGNYLFDTIKDIWLKEL